MRAALLLFFIATAAHADVMEQVQQGWSDLVHVGLEKYLGYSFSDGDFQDRDRGKALADGACTEAEKALSNGKDHEASMKLNSCRMIAIKLRHGPALVRAMALLGELHQAQGKQGMALSDYQATVLVARQFKLKKYEVKSLLGIATLNLQYGDIMAAESSFLKLPVVYRELRSSEAKDLNPEMAAQILYIRMLLGMHKPGGKEMASLWLSPLEDTKDKLGKSALLYYWHAKAEVALAEGKADDAVKCAEQGLEALKQVVPPSDPFQGRLWRMYLAGAKGKALLLKKQFETALIALEEARESFYFVRSEVLGDERILENLTVVARPYFEGATAALVSSRMVPRALQVVADMKALEFGDHLRLSAALGDETKERAFRALVRGLFVKWVEKGGIARKNKTEELFPTVDAAAAGRIDEVSLFARSPGVLTAILPASTMDLDPDEFTSRIPEGVAHIEHMLGEASYAFVVTRLGVSFVGLPGKPQEARPLAEQLRRQVANPDVTVVAAAATGREVHDKFFRAALAKAGAATRVIVSPDGALYAVPLALLHDGVQYVVDSRAMVLSPGLYSTVMSARVENPGAVEPSVALFTVAPADGGRAPASVGSRTPNIGKMAVFSRAASTKENVLGAFLGQKERNVLHLRMDAHIGSDDPWAATWGGQLKVQDLVGYRREGLAMVCATGTVFEDADGGAEAVWVRTLADTGAASGLFTRWQSGGEAEALVLEKYYAEMALGVTGAEALRRGIASVKAAPATSHPYYWAGYQAWGGWK